MELRGVPHGLHWMIFSTLLGAALSAFCIFLMSRIAEDGSVGALIPMGFGALFGIFFLFFGIDGMMRRESLVIDLDLGSAIYRKWSFLFGEKERTEFQIPDVAEVFLEHRKEQRDTTEHQMIVAKIWEAKLRIRRPRKSILLEETQNGREQRVRTVAEQVSAYLNVPLTESGKSWKRRKAKPKLS